MIPDYAGKVVSLKYMHINFKDPFDEEGFSITGKMGMSFSGCTPRQSECDYQVFYENNSSPESMPIYEHRDALSYANVGVKHDSFNGAQNCTCGIYSYKLKEDVYDSEGMTANPRDGFLSYNYVAVFSQNNPMCLRNVPCIVSNWGTIFEYENGFRSEYTQLEGIFLCPVAMSNIAQRYPGRTYFADSLSDYRIFTSNKEVQDFIEASSLIRL